MTLQRSFTLLKLGKIKTVGFWAGLALLFNSMTGPGIPITPAIFSAQGTGAIPSIIAFFFFGIVSAFSVLLIIEAMQGEEVKQAIPALKEFRAWHPKNSTDVIVSAGGRFDSKTIAKLNGYTVTYKLGFNISKSK